MNSVEIVKSSNKKFIYLKINTQIVQVYSTANSTFTIKRFPEEGQFKFYLHTLGIDPSYYNHAGIDLYIKPGGTTSEIKIEGESCDNDESTFFTLMENLFG